MKEWHEAASWSSPTSYQEEASGLLPFRETWHFHWRSGLSVPFGIQREIFHWANIQCTMENQFQCICCLDAHLFQAYHFLFYLLYMTSSSLVDVSATDCCCKNWQLKLPRIKNKVQTILLWVMKVCQCYYDVNVTLIVPIKEKMNSENTAFLVFCIPVTRVKSVPWKIWRGTK